MAMSKKDFEAMATALADAKRDAEYATEENSPERAAAMHALEMAARRVATACAEQYSGGYGFNRSKFLDWSGFPVQNGN